MAEKSGFFNAILENGIYDRKYNANDYCDNLAVVIGNGVLRSANDDLKVTASGMVVTVSAGRGWIKGRYYHNDSDRAFPAITAPIGGTRWDRIVLRYNNDISVRSIKLVYVQGTAAANPVKPSPVRTDTIYDLVLADIYVGTNAQSLTITDTRSNTDLCGWVYSVVGDESFFKSLDNSFNVWLQGAKDTLSSVTLFKRYIWKTTLTAAAKTVQFSIPQWDADTCFLEVYVNGILSDRYTLSNDVITFTNSLVAGTQITVNVYKSIDGTGIMTVADEITELQNKVDTLDHVAKWSYQCRNNNDNISLSQIAQAFNAGSYAESDVTEAAAAFLSGIGGNTYLASLPDDCNVTINVIGKLGVSTPFSGTGTSTSRYKWFSLGQDAAGTKKITFDFSQAERLQIWCTGGTENIIFYGTDLNVRGVRATVKCNTSGCVVQMIAGRYTYGNINFENCILDIRTTGKAIIAENGNFTNCDCYCSSADTHALCFVPTTDALVRVIGGTHKAYTASANAGNVSAIFYTYSTTPNAVIMAYNINCPIVAVSNFYQKKLSVAYAGKTYINGVVADSALAVEGTYNEIVGRITINKR